MRLKYKTWNWLPLYTFWYYRKTWTHKTKEWEAREEKTPLRFWHYHWVQGKNIGTILMISTLSLLPLIS